MLAEKFPPLFRAHFSSLILSLGGFSSCFPLKGILAGPRVPGVPSDQAQEEEPQHGARELLGANCLDSAHLGRGQLQAPLLSVVPKILSGLLVLHRQGQHHPSFQNKCPKTHF